MKKIIPMLFFAQSCFAEMSINAGLSGAWHNNLTPGQGLLIDVIPANNSVFSGWFTYKPDSELSSNQYWFTLQGNYNGSVAELIIYETKNGLFSQSSNIENEAIGFATLVFESCTQAYFEYTLDKYDHSAGMIINRVTPDVLCQDLINTTPNLVSDKNYPPTVSNFNTEVNDNFITLTFDLLDDENDKLDLKVLVLDSLSDSIAYEIPLANLIGHVKFPVLPGLNKSIKWDYINDTGFQQLAINQFKVKLVADDRYVTNMQDIIDLVDEERLITDIQTIEGVRHYQTNPAGLTNARNYIRQTMSEYNITHSDQTFNHLGSQGINIIGQLNGTDNHNEVYIIDGHYDTVSRTPGADDNASGTAGMLEVMRVLSQFNSKTSIKFIGFDKEELGLIGSRHYARNKNPNEKILGLINFEMIGYTCTNQPECINFPNADTSIYNIKSSFADTLSDAFVQIGATHVPNLKITAVTDDGDSNFRRSDHAPFWDIGVDALFLTDGANFRTPHYHQTSDRLQTLDTEFMTQIVKTTVGTIAKLAEISHNGYAESDIITIEN